jgi:hypothetical protein
MNLYCNLAVCFGSFCVARPDKADTVTTRRPSQGGPRVTIDPEEGRALGDEALIPPVNGTRVTPRIEKPGPTCLVKSRGPEEARNPRRARPS